MRSFCPVCVSVSGENESRQFTFAARSGNAIGGPSAAPIVTSLAEVVNLCCDAIFAYSVSHLHEDEEGPRFRRERRHIERFDDADHAHPGGKGVDDHLIADQELLALRRRNPPLLPGGFLGHISTCHRSMQRIVTEALSL